jgi:pyruvate dehydrogenase E2 component (dihydrolipoamide acetyltransferase)
MAVSVVMPALEMVQETGKLLAWKKHEGDYVAKGEMLLEVETDKAVVEIEAAGDGILSAITAREGDVVPVGQTIAWLLKPGEQPPVGAALAQSGRRMDSAAATVSAAPDGTVPSAAEPKAVAQISPKARRLAREHGVDVSRLRGSGPGGEILAADVIGASAAAARPAVPSPAVDVVRSIGRIMAERTTHSWTTVPHFFVVREVDAAKLDGARRRHGAGTERSHGVAATLTDLMVAAVARSLRAFPRMNSSWVGGDVVPNPDVNVALAMAVDDAVVTAVIRDADRIPLGLVAQRRKELAERARASRLQPADITGATFTISNLGMFDVDAFTAIIVPPQAGILAVGALRDRVVAVGGQIGIRPTLTLVLSCDHRVVGGAGAAQFLNDLAARLGDPDTWL